MATRNPSGRICSVEGCPKPEFCRRYCSKHYERWKRHGDPLGGRTFDGSLQAFVTKLLQTGFEKDTCVIWPFGRNSRGYAFYGNLPGSPLVYRYLWEMYYGEDFPPSLVARHICGQGANGCVNPLHVVPGTNQENSDDMRTHGTVPEGERNGHAKITEAIVIEIRRLAAEGVPRKEIAQRFGIKYSNVGDVVRRTSWRYL